MEEDFPRGGSVSKPSKKVKRQSEEPDLFPKLTEEKGLRKGKKRKIKQDVAVKTKKRKPEKSVFDSKTDERHVLSYSDLCEEMLVLGCVNEIHDYKLLVGLPNGLQGEVSIVDIADGYRDQLKNFTELSNSDDIEPTDLGVHTLHDLFKIGQIFPCKVVQNKKLKLTINPKDVHANLIGSSIRNCMTLYGSIRSVEDHGYQVDLGIKGIRVFLSNSDAERYIQLHNEGYPLKVGQGVVCKVKGDVDMVDALVGERSIISITIDPQKVAKATIKAPVNVTMASFVPGMKVDAIVRETSMDGIIVKFLSYSGAIHKSHLPRSPLKYQDKEEIKCCITGIHPTTKKLRLSALPHLVEYAGVVSTSHFSRLAIGQIIEDARVMSLMKGYGLYLSLQDGLVGYASLKNLFDGRLDNIGKVFKQGTTHRCRVLKIDYMDNVAVVTLKKSVLKQRFFSLTDIEPGQLIKCAVKVLTIPGIVVKVTDKINGFIPNIHLADVPIKHPEKKFSAGQKLECRVVTCEPSRNRLILTHKKSLLDTQLPVITDYEQITIGLETEGVIVNIKDDGVLVAFYNDVKGWVPQKNLGSTPIMFPSRVFYSGQVVRCRVIHHDPETRKVVLTFKVAGKGAVKNKPVDIPDDFEVGKMVECEVIKKLDKGVDVKISPSGKMGFIPQYHLADSEEICHLIYENCNVGDVLQGAMYHSCSSTVVLTMKKTLTDYSANGELIADFAEIKPGMILPGHVKNLTSYGIFVEFPGGLIGLAPNKFTTDRRAPDLSLLFKRGQTVMGKVIEVKKEKKRFLISLRMLDCFHGDIHSGVDLLRSYLQEKEKVLMSDLHCNGWCSSVAKIKVGVIYKAEMESILEGGFYCKLPGGAKGFVPIDQVKGRHTDFKAKEEIEVVVLNKDPVARCLELSANPSLIKLIKHRKENVFSEAKVGQVIKSEVELIKEDFILVCLRGHTGGQLAYLPACKHVNDVLERHQFAVGQPNPVVIKERIDEGIIAVLEIHDAKTEDAKHKQKYVVHKKKHNLRIGMTVKATIRSVLLSQMNVEIDEIPARIHITEVMDSMKIGEKPFSMFKEGMEVSAKVIGLRSPRIHKNDLNSSSGFTIPELSLRPSMQNLGDAEIEKYTSQKYKVGDKVLAFVQHYKNKSLWMYVQPDVRGRVYFLNLSEDPQVMENPEANFLPGHWYKATVIALEKNGNLELSLIGNKKYVRRGSLVEASISCVKNGTGLTVRVPGGYSGVVGLTDISDKFMDKPLSKFHCGQIVQCYVLSSDEEKRNCVLSLRKSRLQPSEKKVVDPEVESFSDLEEGATVKGFVICCKKKGVLLCIGRGITSLVPIHQMHKRYTFYKEKLVTCNILSVDTQKRTVSLSMLEEDTEVAVDAPQSFLREEDQICEAKKTVTDQGSNKISSLRKRKISGDWESRTKKKSKVKKNITDIDSGIDTNKESDTDTENKAPVQTETPRLQVSTGFSWDADFELPEEQAISEHSECEESEDEGQQIKRKKTREQIKMERQEEEKKIFEHERQQLDGSLEPQMAADFDRLVLQSPDSSLVWLRYMAFHLETTEIEKARAVAERGLKTISFREEQEKLNLWVGYLNLENMYGTPESLTAVLNRAVQQNEAIQVYQQMINIYVKTGKMQEAEQLHNVLVKRYSQMKEVWIGLGQFYFRENKSESAHKLMQRCLKSLKSKKEHVEVISKFAAMEYKFPAGEPERGRTMFENILANYPKRTDLWSVYIDMLIKQNDQESVRQLFDRVTHLKLPVKKMKFFFKKYLEYEKNYGTDETVELVKKKALDFVELQQHIDA